MAHFKRLTSFRTPFAWDCASLLLTTLWTFFERSLMLVRAAQQLTLFYASQRSQTNVSRTGCVKIILTFSVRLFQRACYRPG